MHHQADRSWSQQRMHKEIQELCPNSLRSEFLVQQLIANVDDAVQDAIDSYWEGGLQELKNAWVQCEKLHSCGLKAYISTRNV